MYVVEWHFHLIAQYIRGEKIHVHTNKSPIVYVVVQPSPLSLYTCWCLGQKGDLTKGIGHDHGSMLA